ncbi:hypothetical protein BDR26DRAFT_880775 [Obelidium mucronatum]|nr:hypothetical protein BDR26DRAFT_880775 [Obelidium mucronatum]
MILSLVLSIASASIAAAATPLHQRAPTNTNVVGAYLLIDPTEGPTKLSQVAAQASTLPINRLTLSFVRPDMHYIPGSNTLATVGFNYAHSGDFGFGKVKDAVSRIQAAGVEVFLSVGGWDYNCWPAMYLRHSIAPYGGANADVIKKYGNGSIENCNAENQWCYACEPPSNGNTPDSFAVFPEPVWSPVWVQATKDVEAAIIKQTKSPRFPPAQWHPEIYGGQSWVDPKTGKREIVAGTHVFADLKRDPYQDLVHLAKDLGLAGIDLDYEEFWHADTFKTGGDDACSDEPCHLYQTVYKYSAIVRDLQLSIEAIYPTLKLSVAAAAVGAWDGDWWGGNLKGLWINSFKLMPELTKFMTQGPNAGGLNIMTYDVSTATDECPKPGVCSLSQQVDFYMGTYLKMMKGNNAGLYVGYEIGTPAYPEVSEQPQLLANLTIPEFATIQATTQTKYPGGFYWEMFKSADSPENINVNAVSQKLCKQLLSGEITRCSGSLPGSETVAVTTTTTIDSTFAATMTRTIDSTVETTVASATAVISTLTETASVEGTTTTTEVFETSAEASTFTTAPPTTTTGAMTPTKTPCAEQWQSTVVYADGAIVSFNSFNYKRQTVSKVPGSDGPELAWKLLGPCQVVTTSQTVSAVSTESASATEVITGSSSGVTETAASSATTISSSIVTGSVSAGVTEIWTTSDEETEEPVETTEPVISSTATEIPVSGTTTTTVLEETDAPTSTDVGTATSRVESSPAASESVNKASSTTTHGESMTEEPIETGTTSTHSSLETSVVATATVEEPTVTTAEPTMTVTSDSSTPTDVTTATQPTATEIEDATTTTTTAMTTTVETETTTTRTRTRTRKHKPKTTTTTRKHHKTKKPKPTATATKTRKPKTTPASPLGQPCTEFGSSKCFGGVTFVCNNLPHRWEVWYNYC